MSSNEEYLESLLQSMMNGNVAGSSSKDSNHEARPKSAIEMLTGEEPEQAPFVSEVDLGSAKLDAGDMIQEGADSEAAASDGINTESLWADEAVSEDTLAGDMTSEGIG